MRFGILEDSSSRLKVRAVFVGRQDPVPEKLVDGLHQVPPDGLVLFHEDFWSCLPSSVFPTDLYALVSALTCYGWVEADKGDLGDHRSIGAIAGELDDVARACLVALEHAGSMKRPYGNIRTTAQVIDLASLFRLAGRNARRRLAAVA